MKATKFALAILAIAITPSIASASVKWAVVGGVVQVGVKAGVDWVHARTRANEEVQACGEGPRACKYPIDGDVAVAACKRLAGTMKNGMCTFSKK